MKAYAERHKTVFDDTPNVTKGLNYDKLQNNRRIVKKLQSDVTENNPK